MISIYYTIFEPSHFPKFERAAVLRQIAWKQWELWTRWLLCIWVDDFLENFESAGWGSSPSGGGKRTPVQSAFAFYQNPICIMKRQVPQTWGKMNETTLQQ